MSSWFISALLVPVLAAPVPKEAATDFWISKVVFAKRPPLRPVLQKDTPPAVPGQPAVPRVVPGRVTISYRVVADEGDWVQVIHNGHPAWLRKADVVRAADAIDHFTKLIQSDPTNLSWPLYRGSAYREIGKYDEGIKDYDTLIAKSPTVFTYWNNRASIKITARRYASAIEDLNKAAELSPDAAIVYRNRGHARFLSKEYDTAIADCNRAIELEPTSAAPVTYRGQCREKQGEYATAAKDFVAALNLEPLNAYSLNARAWFLATVPDAAMQDAALALKLIEQARELSDWKSGSYLDTLAAALAANGRFEEAVRCQEDALRDKKFTEDKGEEAKARLELYRQKKPYRQKGK